jgi:hypothetical protein
MAGLPTVDDGSTELKGRIEDADERHLTLKFKEIKTPSGKKSIEARLVGVDGELLIWSTIPCLCRCC